MANVPPNDRPKVPGPSEVRYLLELTLAYARGIKDVLGVIEEALLDAQIGGDQYHALLDQLRMLLAPGEGGLPAIEDECRVLLGEVEPPTA